MKLNFNLVIESYAVKKSFWVHMLGARRACRACSSTLVFRFKEVHIWEQQKSSLNQKSFSLFLYFGKVKFLLTSKNFLLNTAYLTD